MSNIQKVHDKIQDWLDNREWKYYWDETHYLFTWGLSLDKEIDQLRYYLQLSDIHYTVNVFSELTINLENECDVLALINFINTRMIFGHFELSEDRNTLGFKLSVDCYNTIPIKPIIERSIIIPAEMFKQYGNIILELSTGKKTLVDAIKEVRS